MVGGFFDITSTINGFFNIIIPILFALALVLLVIDYLRKTAKEDGVGHGMYLSIIYLFEVLAVAGVFWAAPFYVEKFLQVDGLAAWIRWGGFLLFFFAQTKEHSKARWRLSFAFHYILLLFSWLVDQWAGILSIAAPLLMVYYLIASQVALAVIPSSNPDDGKEKIQRIFIFISYLWGVQLPLWKTASIDVKEAEKRIDGAPSFLKKSIGMLWTHPHQIAGISNGPKFRAGGPGLIVLSKGATPFEIVDLRNRFRDSKIKAISKDGIAFTTTVSVAFALEREVWTRDLYQELLRTNIMLRDGKEPNENLDGAFPYSQARARSVLSYRGKKITQEKGEQTIRWEDHVLALAEEAAREVLSERSVEYLWKAHENETGTAAEEITEKINFLIRNDLQRVGIKLLNAKAADFSFPSEKDKNLKDKVEEQNIATWSVEWERHRAILLANGQAESERIQQEARTDAHSILLTTIADGLRQTRELHPNLPRYVIAVRFIGTLEKMLEEQPVDDPEAKNGLQNIKQHFLSSPRKE